MKTSYFPYIFEYSSSSLLLYLDLQQIAILASISFISSSLSQAIDLDSVTNIAILRRYDRISPATDESLNTKGK